MKKKVLIIITIISIVLALTIGLVIFFVSTKKEETPNYDEPDANLSCYYKGTSVDDSGVKTGDYVNYMFIYNDDNNYVTKVIYKSVYANSYFNDSLVSLTQEILDLYSDVNGISTSLDVNNDTSVVTITYDYKNIDLKTAKKELKSILDENSFFMNMKTNITVDEYLDIEDPEYICK